MKKFMVIACLSCGFTSAAQHLEEPAWWNGSESAVFASAYIGGASDGLTNRFLNRLFTKEFLSSEEIRSQKDRLRSVNVVGLDYYTTLDGRTRLNGTWSILVTAGHAGHLSGRFSEDAFRLVFEGNTAYKGTTLDLAGTEGTLMRYQKIGLGAAWNDLSTLVGARVSFINGQSWAHIDLPIATLRTSAIGDTLQADVQGQWLNGRSEQTRFGASNGGGFGLDLFMRKTFETIGSRWQVGVQLIDLGVVQWQPGGRSWSVDTVITFTGVEINDVTRLSDTLFQNDLQDSIDRSVRSWQGGGTHNALLPAWVQIQIRQSVAHGVEVSGGFTWRPTVRARTFGWAGIAYRFHPKWAVGTELGYGGFGRVQWSVKSEYGATRLSGVARLGNLESLIAPKRFGGVLGSVGLCYRFISP